MDLDEMKIAWQALNQQLEREKALNTQLYVERRMDKVRHGLRPLFWGQVLQIVLGVGINLVAGLFWFSRMTIAHFLVWGLLVHLSGILMVVAGARNLHLILQIDYSAPVLDIQRRIAALRAWRVQVDGPVFAILGAVIWLPLALMEIGLCGIDLEQVAPGVANHFVLSSAISVSLVVVAYGLIRFAGQRRWMEDNWAGTSVQRAESMLADIARFIRE